MKRVTFIAGVVVGALVVYGAMCYVIGRALESNGRYYPEAEEE